MGLLIVCAVLLVLGVADFPREARLVAFGLLGYPIALALILIGANKWRQWEYAVIFVVVPVSFFLSFAVFASLLDIAGLPGKDPLFYGGILAVPVCLAGAYVTMRWARSRRTRR